MRCGCISSGEIQCDSCHCTIPYPERYLAVDDEGKEGKTSRYCVDCCLKKGYARYQAERGEQVLTFSSE